LLAAVPVSGSRETPTAKAIVAISLKIFKALAGYTSDDCPGKSSDTINNFALQSSRPAGFMGEQARPTGSAQLVSSCAGLYLLRRHNRSEQTVGLGVRASGEVKCVGQCVDCAIAEAQAPQTVDRQRFARAGA
jgi:hypothetical protein